MCIEASMNQLEGVMEFFEKYMNEGFDSSMNNTKSIACKMNIDPKFLIGRHIIRKK